MAEILDASLPFKGEDLTGRKFGRLTVVRFAGRKKEPSGQRKNFWECSCECGVKKIVGGTPLRDGRSTSCGCASVERIIKQNTTHGLKDHPLYATWEKMNGRCSCPTNPKFPRYGGRGIKVLEPWASSFQAFHDDMAPTHKPGLTLDRKNNDGPYCKDNCRWATRREQANNTSTNRFLEVGGERHTVADWARIIGVKPHVIQTKLQRGQSEEKAIAFIASQQYRSPATSGDAP